MRSPTSEPARVEHIQHAIFANNEVHRIVEAATADRKESNRVTVTVVHSDAQSVGSSQLVFAGGCDKLHHLDCAAC